jgi:hypothetical protein
MASTVPRSRFGAQGRSRETNRVAIEQRVSVLRLKLLPVPPPAANYVNAVWTENQNMV